MKVIYINYIFFAVQRLEYKCLNFIILGRLLYIFKIFLKI